MKFLYVCVRGTKTIGSGAYGTVFAAKAGAVDAGDAPSFNQPFHDFDEWPFAIKVFAAEQEHHIENMVHENEMLQIIREDILEHAYDEANIPNVAMFYGSSIKPWCDPASRKHYQIGYRVFERIPDSLELFQFASMNQGVYSHFTPNQVRWIFTEFMKGLHYLHDTLQMAHRDLKMENILIQFEKSSFRELALSEIPLSGKTYGRISAYIRTVHGEDYVVVAFLDGNRQPVDFYSDSKRYVKVGTMKRVVIIDFGFATLETRLQDCHPQVCGTPIYLPPEVHRATHHASRDKKTRYPIGSPQKLDIWAAGIILFELFTGLVPCLPDDLTHGAINNKRGEITRIVEDENLMKNMLYSGHERWRRHASRWIEIPDGARDLILRMLEYDGVNRPNAREVLQHPWIDTTPARRPVPRALSTTKYNLGDALVGAAAAQSHQISISTESSAAGNPQSSQTKNVAGQLDEVPQAKVFPDSSSIIKDSPASSAPASSAGKDKKVSAPAKRPPGAHEVDYSRTSVTRILFGAKGIPEIRGELQSIDIENEQRAEREMQARQFTAPAKDLLRSADNFLKDQEERQRAQRERGRQALAKARRDQQESDRAIAAHARHQKKLAEERRVHQRKQRGVGSTSASSSNSASNQNRSSFSPERSKSNPNRSAYSSKTNSRSSSNSNSNSDSRASSGISSVSSLARPRPPSSNRHDRLHAKPAPRPTISSGNPSVRFSSGHSGGLSASSTIHSGLSVSSAKIHSERSGLSASTTSSVLSRPAAGRSTFYAGSVSRNTRGSTNQDELIRRLTTPNAGVSRQRAKLQATQRAASNLYKLSNSK